MTTAHVVDFTNTKDQSQFNTKRVPAGDYLATITKVEDGEAKSDKTFQYIFTIKLNKISSTAYPYYCKLQENQLWKLRNLLIAAGMTVPKKRMKLDPSKTVGKTIGVTMEDDEYDGKEKSVIAAVFPSAELMEGNIIPDDDEDVEEDEDIEDEPEVEEDAEEADPFEEMDRTALKAYLKSLDPTFAAKKSQTDDDLRALARTTADEPADDEEDEEEEPEPAPVVAKKKTRRAATAKPAAVSDDELDELDIDDI